MKFKASLTFLLAALSICIFLVSVSIIDVEPDSDVDVLPGQLDLFELPRPIETEHALRIFIYEDIPRSLNEELRNETMCRSAYAGAEVLVLELLASTNILTKDPELADFYLMPAMTHCYMLRQLRLGVDMPTAEAAFQRDMRVMVQRIITLHPYWNRTQGRDHLLVLPTEQGAAVLAPRLQETLRNSVHLVGTASLKSTPFQPWKDIVLPPAIMPLDPASLIFAALNTDRGPASPSRTTKLWHRLMEGRGQQEHNLRSKLARVFGPTKRRVWDPAAPPHALEARQGELTALLEEMARSELCVAAEGFEGWSLTLAFAVHMGCVPIIIADSVELPLSQYLNWAKFAFRVPESNVSSIAALVDAISPEQLAEKQSELERVRPKLAWNREYRPGDAFDSLLLALQSKKRFMRNSSSRFWSGPLRSG